MALVASKLKFTHEQGSELLVALEKKQVRPTSIDIHAHTPIRYRPQRAGTRHSLYKFVEMAEKFSEVLLLGAL
jgi:hypothetical protein